MLDHDMALYLSGSAFCFDQKRGGPPQFEIRQIIDSTRGQPPGIHLAAGYRRWLAFDPDDLPGQDFCAFQFDDRYTVGVVADGVSQSFFGNIAARVVGSALIASLWERRSAPPDEDEVRDQLEARQSTLADAVRDHKLSEALDPIVRSALNDARAEGSQTAFGGVVLDRRSKTASIYLLGDITAIVHGSSHGAEVVSALKRGRWSSAAPSLRGRIMRETRTHVASIMLKSDGADDRWGRESCDVIQGEIFCELAGSWAEDDDVSFVWLATEPVSLSAAPHVALPPELANRKPPPRGVQAPERHLEPHPARRDEPVRPDAYRHPYTPRPRPRIARLQRSGALLMGASFCVAIVAMLATICLVKMPRIKPSPRLQSGARDVPRTGVNTGIYPDAGKSESPRPTVAQQQPPRLPVSAPPPEEPAGPSSLIESLAELAVGAPQDRARSGLVLLVITPSAPPGAWYVCTEDRHSFRESGPAEAIVPISGQLTPGKYHCSVQVAESPVGRHEIQCDTDPMRPGHGSQIAPRQDPENIEAETVNGDLRCNTLVVTRNRR